jgi:hypothetical protein
VFGITEKASEPAACSNCSHDVKREFKADDFVSAVELAAQHSLLSYFRERATL